MNVDLLDLAKQIKQSRYLLSQNTSECSNLCPFSKTQKIGLAFSVHVHLLSIKACICCSQVHAWRAHQRWGYASAMPTWQWVCLGQLGDFQVKHSHWLMNGLSDGVAKQ